MLYSESVSSSLCCYHFKHFQNPFNYSFFIKNITSFPCKYRKSSGKIVYSKLQLKMMLSCVPLYIQHTPSSEISSTELVLNHFKAHRCPVCVSMLDFCPWVWNSTAWARIRKCFLHVMRKSPGSQGRAELPPEWDRMRLKRLGGTLEVLRRWQGYGCREILVSE